MELKTRILFSDGGSRMTNGCHDWRPTISKILTAGAAYNHFSRSMIWNSYIKKKPSTIERKRC